MVLIGMFLYSPFLGGKVRFVVAPLVLGKNEFQTWPLYVVLNFDRKC